MNRYYFSHNLEHIHNILLEKEIIPLLSENYFHHPFFVLVHQEIGVTQFKYQLLKQFEAISPGFLMTFSNFKDELYSDIRWNTSDEKNQMKESILMNPMGKS